MRSMPRSWAGWVAGAVAAAALLVVSGSRAQDEGGGPPGGPPARPSCVAFVNLGRVLQANPKLKKLQDDLQTAADQIKADLAALDTQLRKEAGDLERFAPGSAEYEEGRKAIERRRWDADYDGKARLDRLRRRSVTGMANAYQEIRAEAERLAKARGYSGVLSFDDQPLQTEDQGQMVRPSDLMNQMVVRTVIWGSPDHDLTADLIAALAK